MMHAIQSETGRFTNTRDAGSPVVLAGLLDLELLLLEQGCGCLG